MERNNVTNICNINYCQRKAYMQTGKMRGREVKNEDKWNSGGDDTYNNADCDDGLVDGSGTANAEQDVVPQLRQHNCIRSP